LIENLFLKCHLDAPILKLSPDYLRFLMVRMSDRYKGKTSNYFSDAARNKLGCFQRENPTRFEFPQLPEKGELGHGERWDYIWEKGNSRYIEFPMYQFLKPETVKENYSATQIESICKAFEKIEAATAWIAALKGDAVQKADKETDAPLPF
jgi:hypothetical protein